MHFSGSGHNLREAWGTSHWSRHSWLSSLHGFFQALLQGTIFYVQQWLIGQWHKQHGLHGPSTPHQSPSLVSWPASPAKRDRMHLTHLSASSQMVIRACQPQAARAFKKQMLWVRSSQFCCVFLPPCQSLPNLGNLYCLLQLLHQNFLLFTFQILEHSCFF